jgi:hypothetical protein
MNHHIFRGVVLLESFFLFIKYKIVAPIKTSIKAISYYFLGLGLVFRPVVDESPTSTAFVNIQQIPGLHNTTAIFPQVPQK